MEAEFWLNKWEDGKIGFHLSEANPLLVKYVHDLNLQPSNRIFLPLCGKTVDIPWLLGQGYEVTGIELSQKAVEELFISINVKPQISTSKNLTIYTSKNLKIYQGDFFDLTQDILGPVHAIYDRAALIALPEDVRNRYSKHISTITLDAPQLLICLTYDQTQSQGPPFSVNPDEVRRLYGSNYSMSILYQQTDEKGLRGQIEIEEYVCLLRTATN